MVEPEWMVAEYNFDLNGNPIFDNISECATNSLLGYQFRLIVEYAPVTLKIDVFIDYIAPNGAITHYDLTKTHYYNIQNNFEYLYSTDNYKVGTYNSIVLQAVRIL